MNDNCLVLEHQKTKTTEFEFYAAKPETAKRIAKMHRRTNRSTLVLQHDDPNTQERNCFFMDTYSDEWHNLNTHDIKESLYERGETK